MVRHVTAAGALLAIFPSAASAQDAPSPVSTGFRLEALIGYDYSSALDDGLLYGGRLGYDFKIGDGWLLGVDAELNDVTTARTISAAFTLGAPVTVDDGPDLYAGARISHVLSSRFRLFGAAGYTRSRHGFFILLPNNAIGGAELQLDGLRLTAGGQFMLGRRTFLGAEYRYSNYEFGQFRDQVVGTLGFRF